jgi:hypothetical protein
MCFDGTTLTFSRQAQNEINVASTIIAHRDFLSIGNIKKNGQLLPVAGER